MAARILRWVLPLAAVFVAEAKSKKVSKGALEEAIKEAYHDTGAVASRNTTLSTSLHVHYLIAGEGAKHKRTVLFCHGSAFTARTWQVVGVLDALAQQEFTAVAVDLPNRGQTGRLSDGITKDSFVRLFVEKVLDPLSPIVVVTASMGGSYGLPFALHPGTSFRIAGYLTAAGNHDMLDAVHEPLALPLLAIFGDQDSKRVASDPPVYKATFTSAAIVVFKDAPHPCYLRDVAAATEFTDLVLAFVGGKPLHSFHSVSALQSFAAWP